MKHPTVLFLDNTSADNLALALAATRPSSLLDVKAIFVTGRAAHTDPSASIEDREENFSNYIHFLNAARMLEFLQSAGRPDIPIIMGRRVQRTGIRTVIPHHIHADEKIYDLWDSWGKARIHEFADGVQYLRHLKAKKLLALVGGPLTEVAWILQHAPDVAAKFGTMLIQGGDFATDESSNLIGGKGNSFNIACDPKAANVALKMHRGKAIFLPSNMTKQRELGFATPDEIAALGVYRRLVDVYRVHYEHSAKRRGTSLFIHDLGLVMLAEQLIRRKRGFPYQLEPIMVLEVPFQAPKPGQPERRGTVVVKPVRVSTNRFRVVWQDTRDYRTRVAAYLRS